MIVIWQGRLWDGATIHRSQAVKDFLTHKKGRVHLVTLPGYSPELNGSGQPSRRVAMESIETRVEK
ncbi:transposase [Runella sp.]|uniref:transposase n=1 Tax=Runella sp. TaxID=1960881 RepID=UPI003D13C46B